MVLGDNIFFGHGLPELLARAAARDAGGTVFGYCVTDPKRYGVLDFETGCSSVRHCNRAKTERVTDSPMLRFFSDPLLY